MIFIYFYTVVGSHFWIGAIRNPSDLSWRWNVDNTALTYVFWDYALLQPSGLVGEDCAGYHLPNAKWYDHKCAARLDGYICERVRLSLEIYLSFFNVKLRDYD